MRCLIMSANLLAIVYSLKTISPLSFFQLPLKISNVSRLPSSTSFQKLPYVWIRSHHLSQKNIMSAILIQQIESNISIIIKFCYIITPKRKDQLTILQVNNLSCAQLGSSGLGWVRSMHLWSAARSAGNQLIQDDRSWNSCLDLFTKSLSKVSIEQREDTGLELAHHHFCHIPLAKANAKAGQHTKIE